MGCVAPGGKKYMPFICFDTDLLLGQIYSNILVLRTLQNIIYVSQDGTSLNNYGAESLLKQNYASFS